MRRKLTREERAARFSMVDEELKEIRGQLGLSRGDMAKRLGISPRTLERLEQGSGIITPPIAKFAALLLEYEKVKADLASLKRALRFLREEERKPQTKAGQWKQALDEKHAARERYGRRRERDEGLIGTDTYDPRTGETWRRED